MADRITAIILVLFGGAVVFESWRMPRFENIGGTIYNAPGLVPGLLGAIIVLMGGLMLGRTFLARSAKHEQALGGSGAAASAPPSAAAPPVMSEVPPETIAEGASAGGDQHAEPASAGMRRFAWILGLSLVFAAGLVGRVPFWLAVFLFVFASIVVFERGSYKTSRLAVRGLVVAAVIAGATAYAVPFVFERIFLVNLP